VSNHSRSLASWGQGIRDSEILYLLAGENGNRIMMGRIDKDAEDVDGLIEITSTELAEAPANINSGFLFTNWDGTTGTLVERVLDKEGLTTGLATLAPQVAQLTSKDPYDTTGVLTNYENGVGTLELLTKDGDKLVKTEIARGYPIQNQSVEPDVDGNEGDESRRAFIADSEDGVTGNLYLTDEPGPGTSPTDMKVVGENAHVETARFLEQPRAIAYLSRKPGQQYAQLKAYLIESGLTLTIHERVSEYRTVPWPAPGILYAVPSGDDAGLWFSKAR
jgi:hypothetical protein